MPAVEQDLTQGSVTRKLVRYALPLVASSLLQAIYSITDIIIAGAQGIVPLPLSIAVLPRLRTVRKSHQ